MYNFILMIVVAYLFGSLPNGVWVGKTIKNIDIREHGSKNSGATNAYRILGAKCGVLVLCLDILKGYLPLFIGANYFGITGNYLLCLGLVAILGHSFSLFLKFRGGKGVATSLGVFLFLFPKGIIIVFIIFLLIVKTTKYSSLGSVIGAMLLPVLALFISGREGISTVSLFSISLLISILVIYKHIPNIKRIKAGTENKIKF